MKRTLIVLACLLFLVSCKEENIVLQDIVINTEPEKVWITDIKDATKSGEIDCADALEPFYNDGKHIYSFSCIKSEHITVYYSNGTNENIKDALESGRAIISDLDNYNINYYKEAISSTTIAYTGFDAPWSATFSGKDSTTLTELLSSLDYSGEMCKCLPEYTIKTEIGTYGVHLSELESYARFGTKQVTLTEEQTSILNGIIAFYSIPWGTPKN